MIHIIYAWYPWHCLCLVSMLYTIFTSGNHDIQYSCLVSIWCTLFRSNIHDARHLCLISMICYIYVSYPWYPIFTSSIYDAQYLFLLSMILNTVYIFLNHGSDFMYCGSHPNKFSTYIIGEEIWTLVHIVTGRSRNWSQYNDPHMFCPVTWLGFIPNLISIGQKVWPYIE